jgi:6-phosphogluconolactonase
MYINSINQFTNYFMDYAQIATDTDQEFIMGSSIILTSLINASLLEKGACLIALSGGSTPREVYTELGKSTEIDWQNVWLCLVDERYVPAGDKDSNAQMIRETLLKSANIPEDHLIFPDTSLPIDECIDQYNKAFENIKPDIVTLGLGPDGHIASIFPPVTEAAMDRGTQIIHTETDIFDVHDRISMTLPAIARIESTVFMLKGEDKLKVWEEMQRSTDNSKRWPAKAILQSSGVTVVTSK